MNIFIIDACPPLWYNVYEINRELNALKPLVTDDEKLKMEIIKDTALLTAMNESPVNKFPLGSVTFKYYKREKHMDDNSVHISIYKYECLYIDGKQYHLPKNKPDSRLWELSRQVKQRRDLENSKSEITERIKNNIKRVYNCTGKRLEYIFSEKMSQAKENIDNMERFEKFRDKKSSMPTDDRFVISNGSSVRSKNEIIVSGILDKLGIPYLYEARLCKRDCGQIRPDFTLFAKRIVIHLELMGLYDKETYRKDIAEKRKIYSKMHENVVFINMTDGIDAAKLEAIIYKIINYKFSGQIVTCVPEKLREKMKKVENGNVL